MRDTQLYAGILGIEAPWRVKDVELRLDEDLIKPTRLRELFEEMHADLVHFPALEPTSLASRLDEVLDD